MTPWQHKPAVLETVTVPKPQRHQGTISNQIRRTVTNLPIRVPAMDWASVVVGEKRMFRCYSERKRDRCMPVVPPETECPRPCLLFSVRHNGPARSRRWEAAPGVLLSHRQEPLGSITSDDLAAEGFEFLPAFRFYWQRRYRTVGWRPWEMVSVIEVRPCRSDGGDDQRLADWLLEHLYGDFWR